MFGLRFIVAVAVAVGVTVAIVQAVAVARAVAVADPDSGFEVGISPVGACENQTIPAKTVLLRVVRVSLFTSSISDLTDSISARPRAHPGHECRLWNLNCPYNLLEK